MEQNERPDLRDGTRFWWATGIEDTFITAPWPGTGRTLDEYELTGHYEQRDADVARMASLGVPVARYGIPWHRIQPAPGTWDWEWSDRALEGLLERGITPIVDLVHYGLPQWIEGAWLHPDLPARMAEYAARVADRFRGRIHWYTPLNEPRITAWYCGRIGWWPPNRRGWRGFIDVMAAACRGIVESMQALAEVDPDIGIVAVDATDLYESDDPLLADDVRHRQAIVFLALDLIQGRVGTGHPLRPWLERHGASLEQLAWFETNGRVPDVVGLNLYPMFTRKQVIRTRRGQRIRMPVGSGRMVEALARMYWQRYDLPLMITETAAAGSLAKRRAWLDASVASVRAARAEGIPVVGYTWWPMFALVAWAWRQGRLEANRYLVQMGLWDLEAGADGTLERVPTPLVDAYKALVSAGTTPVGPVSPPPPARPGASAIRDKGA